LSVAGRRDPLFTASAMRHVYRFSGGVPRLINIVCDRALLGAYSLDRQRVSTTIVRRARRETRGMVPWYRRLGSAWALGLAAAAALLVGIAIFLTVSNPTSSHQTVAAANMMANGDRIRAAGSEPAPSATATEIPRPEATGVQPKARVLPVSAPTGAKLADILDDTSLRGTSGAGFSALYAQWGIKAPLSLSELGCSAGRERGFECLFQVGGWPKLRRFDLPAILEMVLSTGLRHRVALVALGDDSATLAIGGRQFTFPLLEIDRVWDGSFIILWKPPFAWRRLSVGMRGNDVIWLRQTLDALDGKPAPPDVSDSYDEGLRRRVVDYQRHRSLIPDGFVGSETLVRLAVDLEKENAPSISRRAP
jgi:general secretion pathway protein A